MQTELKLVLYSEKTAPIYTEDFIVYRTNSIDMMGNYMGAVRMGFKNTPCDENVHPDQKIRL